MNRAASTAISALLAVGLVALAATARNWPSTSGTTTPGAVLEDGSTGANLVAGGALKVNCTVGCAGGTSSNASDAVATSATNGQTDAWLYGFNGTTWDRLQVDGSKRLKAIVDAGTGWGLAIGATTSGSQQSLVGGAVTTGVPTYTTAQSDPLSLQTDGSLRVAPTPTAVPSAGITPSMSTAVESGHVICSGPCNLYELFVTTDANAEWIEIFDATAVPADGAITPGASSLVLPPIAIAANSTVSLAAQVPLAYANGLSVACSSTGGLTKTASVHCLFGWQKK